MKPASCHPELDHKARGLCRQCYEEYQRSNPAYMARRKEANLRYQERQKVRNCVDCGRAVMGIRCRSCRSVIARASIPPHRCPQCQFRIVHADGQTCRHCLAGEPGPRMTIGRCLTQGCTSKGRAHSHCSQCTYILPLGHLICGACKADQKRRELRDSDAPSWHVDRYRLHNPAA